MSTLPTRFAAALVLVAVAASAGCLGADESAEPEGSDVNNAGGPSADYDVAEVGPDGCIASTTGEETSDPAANPCPQGTVPPG